MADDDDYMSDKFLQSDTQPGLMPKIFLEKHKRKENSQHSKKKKLKPQTKPRKVIEAENRTAKLNTALDETNKGFSMLSKMGFKKGMGLGKEGQGRVEPICVDLKHGRQGLGTEEEEKRKKRKLEEINIIRLKQRQFAEHQLRGDFKKRLLNKQNEKQVKCDLYKSQKVCEQLDSRKDYEKPFPWAWPIMESNDVEEEEEEEEFDDEEYEEEDIFSQLDLLTNYLRTMHTYCIWCGTSYNNTEDLAENCPGMTYEDHEDS